MMRKPVHVLTRTILFLALSISILGFAMRVAAWDPSQPHAPDFGSYDGLLIGVTFEGIGGTTMAGAVHYLPGSATGLTATGSQFWHEDSPNIPDSPEYNEAFGEALAAGDFDGDGYPDLAIGIPAEMADNGNDSGAVLVMYGSAAGYGQRNALWDQDSPGVPDSNEDADSFGEALAAGDFNGDGYVDLAIGNPSEGFQADNYDALGAVTILYGSPQGLTADGAQMWHQDSPGMLGEAEDGDFFGDELVSDDFNGDGYDDLAIGVHRQEVNGELSAGAVQIMYGSAQGLRADGNQLFDQGRDDVSGRPKEDDDFGQALAAGDFNGDGYADLAVGVHNEDVDGIAEAGAVQVFYGSDAGLTTPDQRWTQNTGSLPGQAEEDEDFGYALAAGDFNGDGFEDLAVGIRDENVGNQTEAGGVQIIYGSAQGLTDNLSQHWTQNDLGDDPSESGDGFGAALAAGDFNWDGYMDLAVGAPYEDVDQVSNAGGVQIIYGSAQGLTPQSSQWWTQNNPGVADTAEERDFFGDPLAIAPRAGCPDRYEPNDNFDQAKAISPGHPVRAYLCAGEYEDFFMFYAVAGQQITIDLTNIPANADYDLWLNDPDQNQVASSTNSGRENERIVYTASLTGAYYIVVTSYTGASDIHPYRLNVALSGGATPTPQRLYLPIISRRQ